MLLDPRTADSHRLPFPRFENGQVIADYSKDPRERIQIRLFWSPDLVHWFKPGETGFPEGYQDIDLGTGGPECQNRRIHLPAPLGNRGFFRWAVSRADP